MKKLLLLFTLIVLSKSIIAQNNVVFKIHHKLGETDFAMYTAAKNNLGDDFNVTRLQYYISGISIVHDNGIVTSIDSFYILADASIDTEADLGYYPIQHVEGIHFYVGVDPEHNHTDPAGYDPYHPLAPQAPSMHWGWAAGYRFVAFEGNGGPQYNQLIQIHGLGDQNYIKARVNLNATADNNVLTIDLDADYTHLLENLSVNGGLIVHSETDEAQVALVNMRNLVFSPSTSTTATSEPNSLQHFELFPNPSINGQSIVYIPSSVDQVFDIMVTDINGKQTGFYTSVKANTNIGLNFNQPGMYAVSILRNGVPVSTQKMVSK